MDSLQIETVLDSLLIATAVVLGSMGWSLIVITLSVFLS
jgi:hypothetical protein